MTREILLEPNEKQQQFFTSDARYTAYGGARGGGKSWAMRMKLVLLALEYDGIQILLLRRTLGELRENHLFPLLSLLNGVARYASTEKEFRFPNGSRIRLGYCDSENDVLQFQGQAYEVIGMEEATHFTERQFSALTECNRYSGSMKQPFRPRMYFTCNPGGVGHDWVKRLFVDRCYRVNENPDDYVMIRSLVFDNRFLMERNPEYVRTLQALPEARRRAMLYGDWNSFEGAFFPEFDYEKHTCEVFDIPKDWTRFRALDYGLDMTACLWLAVGSDRTLYVYRELYESDLTLSQAGKHILEQTPAEEEIRYTVASPDLWNRRQDSGKSGFDILSSVGIRRLVRANNARIPGWRVLREYLRTGENGQVRMKILRCCRNLIRTLPLLRFDTNVIEDASDTPHELTHAPEALRYGVMSRVPTQKPKAAVLRSELYSFPRPQEVSDYEQIIAY